MNTLPRNWDFIPLSIVQWSAILLLNLAPVWTLFMVLVGKLIIFSIADIPLVYIRRNTVLPTRICSSRVIRSRQHPSRYSRRFADWLDSAKQVPHEAPPRQYHPRNDPTKPVQPPVLGYSSMPTLLWIESIGVGMLRTCCGKFEYQRSLKYSYRQLKRRKNLKLRIWKFILNMRGGLSYFSSCTQFCAQTLFSSATKILKLTMKKHPRAICRTESNK